MSTDVPNLTDVPDLGGPIPEAYQQLLESVLSAESDSRRAAELDARLRIWLTFTRLRADQLWEEKAQKQAAAIKAATWVLAFSTIGLMLATAVLVWVTATSGA